MQAEQEMSVARQAVDLGDDERSVAQSAKSHSLRQLGAVIVLAALDFDELLKDRPAAAVEKILDGFDPISPPGQAGYGSTIARKDPSRLS